MTWLAALTAFAAVFVGVLGVAEGLREHRASRARARLVVSGAGSAAREVFAALRERTPSFFGRRAERRLVEQLPEAIHTIARAIRAGQTVEAALHEAGRSLSAPAGREFLRIREQIGLGVPFERAVRSLSERHPGVVELRFLAAAFALQRRSGGGLGELLDPLARALEDRASFRRELRALTAEGRATAWVIGALPLAFLLLTSVVRPEYAGLLFEHPTGRALLAAAVALEVAGFVAVRRMAQVEA